MASSSISPLPDRTVITLAGRHRLRLLEGLLTCRVDDLEPGTLRYGALLTPQGKIVTDMMIFTFDDYVQLDVPSIAADDLSRRLTMYRLRAEVSIEKTAEVVVVSPHTADSEGWTDPRSSTLGSRRILDKAPDVPEVVTAYHEARIAGGFPETGTDYPANEMFPHDVNMDMSGAVDFQKGCFVGQEVVSRMRHRGTARRRTVLAAGDGPLPASGTPITSNGKPAGVLGSSVGAKGLAIVRIDRAGSHAEVEGVSLTLSVPQGAPFALSGDLSDA